MIALPGNIWAALKDKWNNSVVDLTDSGAPTNGTSGTGAGLAAPGSTYTDYTNKATYVNRGTLASPIWNLLQFTARALWDFAVDGGTIGTITPAQNYTLPNKAIIIGGIADVITTFVGATATIAIGTSAGSSSSSLKAATAVGTYAAGLVALVPVFTAASAVKLTAAGAITITIATANLTAGKMGIQLCYLLGD